MVVSVGVWVKQIRVHARKIGYLTMEARLMVVHLVLDINWVTPCYCLIDCDDSVFRLRLNSIRGVCI